MSEPSQAAKQAAAEYTYCQPCCVDGSPDAYTTWIKIENQTFALDGYQDTKEEAEWFRIMLGKAFVTIIDQACAERDEELRRIKQDFKNLAETVRTRDEELLRLFDLVRYMRAELHIAGLLSDEEYFKICESGSTGDKKGSRVRLETYDEQRGQIAQMVQDMMKDGEHIAGLAEQIVELTRDKERLDWLETCQRVEWHKQTIPIVISTPGVYPLKTDIRQAIDAAQRGE